MDKEQSLPDLLSTYESLIQDLTDQAGRLDRVLSALAGKGYPPTPATQERVGNTIQDRLAANNEAFSMRIQAIRYAAEVLEATIGIRTDATLYAEKVRVGRSPFNSDAAGQIGPAYDPDYRTSRADGRVDR